MKEPTFETKAEEIHKQLSTAKLIVIHNASFDTSFLNQEFETLGLFADNNTNTVHNAFNTLGNV